MTKAQGILGVSVAVVLATGVLLALFVEQGPVSEPNASATSSPVQSTSTLPQPPVEPQTGTQPERINVMGYWECLPKKGPGPHTMECAFGIAIDQSDGHYGVNTSLMSTYPVDFTTGQKVRISGTLHPAEPNTSYDIDGVIWATTIEPL